MKYLILFAGLFMIISCNGQQDLENLKFNEKISFLQNTKKDFSINVPLEGIYRVENINKFKFLGLPIKKDSIKFKDEDIVYSNFLNIVVNSYSDNKYLGFELELVDEKLGDEFFNLLKKKYGNPLKKYTNANGKNVVINYLWQNKASDEIIFFEKNSETGHTSLSGNEDVLSQTRIILLKDGLSTKPNKNDPHNTPEKIEALLKTNPKAFEMLEFYKSQIPD